MYPSDLTDSQWQVIEVVLADKRKRKHSLRRIFNAIVYLTKTGNHWRQLPNDFPKWQICYYYFQKWIKDQTWIRLNTALVGLVRQQHGRDPNPSLGIIDSQSVKSSEWGVPDKGFDGNKKIQGRKRQIIVDILGLILSADVHAANQYDGNAAENVVQELFKRGYKRMKKLLAEKGYRGELEESVKKYKLKLKIVKARRRKKGFRVEAKRWIVERTISWLNWMRRLSKDYECNTENAAAFLYIANIMVALRKI